MPAQNTIEVVIKATDRATRELKQMSRGLEGIGAGIKALGNFATGAAAGIAVIGTTMAKAFDLGREGAAIMQTRDSFTLLLEKVDAAPDLLEKLQLASKGTIDDLSLMSSTATLLAGATGDLATGLADATPELLEIAKAAQKLNPSLGDTTFLYQSLATGIKRASPLILDNLGLTIKVGEANEKMAEALGKTVEELTAEEQKQALLNETLRAGRILIEQAGGNADSATDAFDRLQASTTNIANAMKEKLVPILSSAATTLELLIMWQDRVNAAFGEQEGRLRTSTQTYDEYVEATLAAAETAGYMVSRVDEQGNVFIMTGGFAEKLSDNIHILSQAEWELANAAQAGTEPMGAQIAQIYAVGDAAADAAPSLYDLAASAKQVASDFGEIEFDSETLWQMAAASGASIQQLALLADQLDITGSAQIEATLKAYQLMEQFAAGEVNAGEVRRQWQDIGQAQEEAIQRQQEAMRKLLDFGAGEGSVSAFLQGMQTESENLQRSLEGAYSQTQIMAENLWPAMDTLDQKTFDTTETVNELTIALGEVPPDVPSDVRIKNDELLFEQLVTIDGYFKSWTSKPWKIDIQVNAPRMPDIVPGVPGYATGTTYHPGGLAVVGENGPEVVALPRGSQVIPGNTAMPTTNVTVNVNGARDATVVANEVIARLRDQGVIRSTPLR